MPKLKNKGRETLRQEEFDKIIHDCDKVAKPLRLRCILGIIWIFGKRINEVLKLKREDLWFSNGYLVVRFNVGKKRRNEAVRKTYIKQTIETSKYVQQYIKPYIDKIERGYIFASYGKGEHKRVIMGSKVYEYELEGGHIHPSRVRQQLKEINETVWPHLIRHSLATRMAEKGVGVPQLMAWFDWDSANVAMNYVEGTPQMIEDIAKREF
jgi:integrase